MKNWSVSARAIVDLTMDVRAESRDDAERMLHSHLSVSANMVDLDQEDFEIWNECIEDIEDIKISGAAEL